MQVSLPAFDVRPAILTLHDNRRLSLDNRQRTAPIAQPVLAEGSTVASNAMGYA